jgi:hypothetical protein
MILNKTIEPSDSISQTLPYDSRVATAVNLETPPKDGSSLDMGLGRAVFEVRLEGLRCIFGPFFFCLLFQ